MDENENETSENNNSWSSGWEDEERDDGAVSAHYGNLDDEDEDEDEEEEQDEQSERLQDEIRERVKEKAKDEAVKKVKEEAAKKASQEAGKNFLSKLATKLLGQGAAGAGAGAAGAGIYVLGIIILIVILIIIIIGLVAFVTYMPNAAKDKVVGIFRKIGETIQSVVAGGDTVVPEEQIIEVAQYLEDMGYDLVGYGFASKVEYEDGTVVTNESKDDQNNDEEKVIKSIKTKYIPAYLVAENRTYMISNYNINLKDMFQSIATYKSDTTLAGNWGAGMIVLDQSIWNALEDVVNDISIDRASNTMKIGKLNTSSGLKVWKWHYDNTYYNLEGWTGRYGKPYELLFTIHLATMAPDLAYELAMNDDLDTKINIGQKNVSYTYHVEVTKDGKTLSDINEIRNTWGDEAADGIIKISSANGTSTIKTSTMYIKSVTNHWFRDVYFDVDGPITVAKVNKEEQEESEGEEQEETEGKEQEETEEVIDEKTGEKSRTDYVYTDNPDGTRTLETETLSNGIHVYDKSGTDVEDEMEYTGDEIPGLEGATIVLKGKRVGDIVQKEEAVRGVTNPTTKDLFLNKEYFIYDGTKSTAQSIEDGTAQKRKINMTKNSLGAFTILEQIDTLDSQLIYRDLKELTIELGYFNKEDFEEIERKCMEWPIPDYTPVEWPFRRWEKQVLGYGTLIRSKASCDALREEEGLPTAEEEEAMVAAAASSSSGTKINGEYKVAIMAGHSSNPSHGTSGAASIDGKYVEREKAIIVAEKAQKYLEEDYGIEVVQTGSTSSNTAVPNEGRLQKAKDQNVDLLVGIHFEANDAPSGVFGVYNSGSSQESHKLGDIIVKKVAANIGLGIRSDFTKPLSTIGNGSESFPSVIIEGGNMGSDISKNMTEAGLDGYAKGVAQGIAEYLSVAEGSGGGSSDSSSSDTGTSIESFDGFMYVGDSWGVGMRSFMEADGVNVQTESGWGGVNWLKSFDRLTGQNPKGIIVFLGINHTTDIQSLKSLLEKLKSTYPNVPIVSVKVPHMGKNWSGGNIDDWNKKIDTLNSEIDSFCSSNGISRVDASSGIVENGYLKLQAGDGFHLNSSDAYQTFWNNIKEGAKNAGVSGSGTVVQRNQVGFEPDLDVIAMINSEVDEILPEDANIYTTSLDEGLEIKGGGLKLNILSEKEKVKGFKLVIFGFDVDSSITVGQKLEATDVIGKTTDSDICMLLIDDHRAIVSNIEDYIKVPDNSSTYSGSAMNIQGIDSIDPALASYIEKKAGPLEGKYPGIVNMLKAISMNESGGNNNPTCKDDPMQAAESKGKAAGSGLGGLENSVDAAVELMVSNWDRAESKGITDKRVIIQAYNFGPGFIDYVAQNSSNKKYTKELATQFSNMWKAKKGWSRYGDINYVDHKIYQYLPDLKEN